ncbi:hypothetical protein EIP86_008856 [Pleurotus ostreatoroseus]|nr:hypothetical protein EIP86_008856 [Pleurotus ostreatoroseus]
MLWILLLQLAAHGCWTRYKRAAEVHGIRIYNRLCRVGMNMGRAIPQRNGLLNSTGHEFWLARERNVLSEREHLDEDALTWVLPWLSHNSLPQLQSCLGELSLEEKNRFVGSWVAQALNLNTVSEHVRDAGTDGTRFDQHMLANVDSDFAQRFKDLLLDLLPTRWVTATTLKEQHYGPAFLLLLRQIAKIEPGQDRDYVLRYTKRVLAIRRIQGTISGDDFGDVGGGLVRLPTVALFECCDTLKYEFDDSEFANLCQWNQEVLAIREPLFSDFYPSWNHYFDLLFASSATYFAALAQRPGRLHNTHNLAECSVIIEMFNDFLPSEVARIRVLASEAEHLCVDGVTYSVSQSLLSITRSLAALINSGHLAADPQSRSASTTLLTHLREVFDSHERFAEGVEILGTLKGYSSISSELPVTSMS